MRGYIVGRKKIVLHSSSLSFTRLPVSNHQCVFLFTYSLFDAQHPDQLHPPEMLQYKFRTSLAFWLLFINSNRQIAGSTLPQVFVVVTHVDQLRASRIRTLPDLLQPNLTQVATEFEQVVHVTAAPLNCMDARSAKTVKPSLTPYCNRFEFYLQPDWFGYPRVFILASLKMTRNGLEQFLSIRTMSVSERACFRNPGHAFKSTWYSTRRDEGLPGPSAAGSTLQSE